MREGTKTPLFGSADIVNVCNLKCVHCYWWTNREATAGELTPEQWRTVIQNSYKKMKIANVTVVGGEPMLRKDVIKVFSEELKNRISVVTNGMFPMMDINGFYFVSIDGTEETHNRIRGPNTYARIKKNVKDFVGSGGSVAINMTLNTLNYKTIIDVLHEWDDIAGRISIQFHTPFIDNDPLWLPFGEERNRTIDSILEYSRTREQALRDKLQGTVRAHARQLGIQVPQLDDPAAGLQGQHQDAVLHGQCERGRAATTVRQVRARPLLGPSRQPVPDRESDGESN